MRWQQSATSQPARYIVLQTGGAISGSSPGGMAYPHKRYCRRRALTCASIFRFVDDTDFLLERGFFQSPSRNGCWRTAAGINGSVAEVLKVN